MTRRVVIDGNSIHDIPSFYDEINRVLVSAENWEIANSLDALNDLLYGGFGILKEAGKIEIVWLNMEKSRQILGFKATKDYYLGKLKPGSPFNKELFSGKLAALENGTGETYFDTIMEIIAEHPNVVLISE